MSLFHPFLICNSYPVSLKRNVQLATTLFLKNKIAKSWMSESPRTSRLFIEGISAADKQALKQNFLQLLIATHTNASSKSIRLHLAFAFNRMVSHDFPANWPGLLDDVRGLLGSSEMREIEAGLVALLEIVKSFRYRQANADVLVGVIEATFPIIVELGLKLVNAASGNGSGAPTTKEQAEDIAYLLHVILKSYKSTLVLNLSAHQQTSGSIVPWGRLLFAVINFQVPKELLPDEEEEREKCEWWKAKKWAYGTLDRLFHRLPPMCELI